MKKKTIVKNVEKDFYKLVEDFKTVTEQYNKKQISDKKYERLKYIIACKSQYLLGVVDAAKQYNISFELPIFIKRIPQNFEVEELNLECVLRFIVDDFASQVNFERIGRVFNLNSAVKELAEKYSPLLPLEEHLHVD